MLGVLTALLALLVLAYRAALDFVNQVAPCRRQDPFRAGVRATQLYFAGIL